jgi:D-3-phosphoglycerate dehydrogenase
MATNKKKIFITESMSQPGRALLKERDDVEIVEFPNMISAADFEAMLKAQAPVHGVALGGTRFGEPGLRRQGHEGRDPIGRLRCRCSGTEPPRIPLMVAGTRNSPSVAEQALFMC